MDGACIQLAQNQGSLLLLFAYFTDNIIGASLSEPHTYRTAVQNPPDI